jgi:malonate-semialdehyde dehydrogenase (acetylating)/methylmalonate-semialdehyde dehydrogenase
MTDPFDVITIGRIGVVGRGGVPRVLPAARSRLGRDGRARVHPSPQPAAGASFVLKPSERVQSVSLLIAELWTEAGLPAGVFNVVHGDKESVDAILDHPDIAAVSFVGSTPIARYIHQRGTENGKRVQALGGAKNHAIVLHDADVDFASDHLVAAAFGSAGERCMAISAAVTVGTAADSVVEAVIAKARAVKVVPGRDASSEMGPVVTPQARNRIVGLIGSGEEQGARLAVDGRGLTVPGYESGFWVGPTVIDEVTPGMDVYREEISGPVLSVVRADAVDTAIDLINANPYGSGTAIFTASGEAARRLQRGVKVGMIGISVPVPMAYYFLRRLEGLAVRPVPHPRPRRRRVLHQGQGRHLPLASRRTPSGRRLPLPDGQLRRLL